MEHIDQSLIIDNIEKALQSHQYGILTAYLHHRRHSFLFSKVIDIFSSHVQIDHVDYIKSVVTKSAAGGYLYSSSVIIHCDRDGENQEKGHRFHADLKGYFSADGTLLRTHYPHCFFILPPLVGVVGDRKIRMFFSYLMDEGSPQVCCFYEHGFSSYYRMKTFALNGRVFGRMITASGTVEVIKDQIDDKSPVIVWMKANREQIWKNWARCIGGKRPKLVKVKEMPKK